MQVDTIYGILTFIKVKKNFQRSNKKICWYRFTFENTYFHVKYWVENPSFITQDCWSFNIFIHLIKLSLKPNKKTTKICGPRIKSFLKIDSHLKPWDIFVTTKFNDVRYQSTTFTDAPFFCIHNLIWWNNRW